MAKLTPEEAGRRLARGKKVSVMGRPIQNPKDAMEAIREFNRGYKEESGTKQKRYDRDYRERLRLGLSREEYAAHKEREKAKGEKLFKEIVMAEREILKTQAKMEGKRLSDDEVRKMAVKKATERIGRNRGSGEAI